MHRQLKPHERSQIILLWNEKYSTRKIAKILNVSQPTVVNTIKKYQTYNTFEHLKNNGRLKKINSEVSKKILELNDKNKKLSLRKISNIVKKDCSKDISYSTIRRFFHEKDIFAYSPVSKPLLKPIHIKNRFIASECWIKMEEEVVKSIIFSDETKINLYYSDGVVSVWRKAANQIDSSGVMPTIKFGGGSVMVWGCFSYNGVGKLHFIEDIMDGAGYCNILSNNLLSSVNKMKLKNFIFMHDNDPKHKSRIVKAFIEENNIRVLDWPAQSPDMNPIENLWRYVKLEVAKIQPKTKNELKEAIKIIWEGISVDQCRKLALSFKSRALELFRARGKYTSY